MLAVANYHYIRDDFSAKHPSIFGLTPKEFEQQLIVLSKHGDFISQEELLANKEGAFTKNYILITFDDGLKEQYTLAKPILDRLGIPYIFFINTANYQDRKVSLVHKIHMLRSEIPSLELLQLINKSFKLELDAIEQSKALVHYNYDDAETAQLKYLLNFKLTHLEQVELIGPIFNENYDEKIVAKSLYFEDEMLKTLFNNGNLGSHSHNHIPLGKLPLNELDTELKKAQEFFLNRFSKPADIISYPYGSYEACSGISELVELNNFKLGFTMERAVNSDIETAPYLLSRYDCNDLPMGKSDLFKTKAIFEKPVFRKWYKNENSSTNK